MDQQLYLEFMNEHVIPLRAKFDDFLPVILGLRKAAQIIMPAELPDAGILGATIDDRFRQKMAGQRLPGESLTDYLKSRAATMRRKKNKAQDLRFRLQLLSDIYSDVVEKSRSYQVYMDWIDRWGLKWKELEARPTIREIYIFNDDDVAVELEELQDLRKDIRYAYAKHPDPSSDGSFRVFPEEHNAAFLRKAGEILGFPVCCIERYIFDRNSGVLSPEVRASYQIAHSDRPEDVDIHAYFTKDFFPCQPDCEEAAAMGRAIHEALSQVDPDLAGKYQEHLNSNMNLVRQYPDIIQNRLARLQQEAKQQGVDPGEE
ncbi:MAG: hypothetical protein ACOX34_07305 [Bacillota bacterium]|jgi:hypothetical protein|nr:hypothetical protein [Candidatus Fermentithermobacillaceae bacterium]